MKREEKEISKKMLETSKKMPKRETHQGGGRKPWENDVFVLVPIGFPLDVFDGDPFGLLSKKKFRTLAVEFDTFIDDEFGDVNGNHVGVDVNSVVLVKVGNASSINLVLNSGEKFQSWIDYEAGSKRLEIRLAKLGGMKPIDPLVSCSIDLSRMWKEDEAFIGLSSSNGNSSQSCNVHSWSFELKVVPH
ncbi:L-type lectin-domain containing receptor kinase VIII.2-like [Diospyros lotus]|uniref:L-type lectin-domain containing receptor kinase VIII.2-like n=1 Tax=Diospyros lotus TaxID=55363 RepID=UPI002257D7C1|nr:L-type lectin-domain containing receptor kinase VIII.2-like [Diospyros lotus]